MLLSPNRIRSVNLHFIVLSNERIVHFKGIITYLPIYYVMFLEHRVPEEILL